MRGRGRGRSGTLVPLDASQGNSLTEQITNGIRNLIDSRVPLPGERLTSLRRFARQHRVSVFTVIQTYDRLPQRASRAGARRRILCLHARVEGTAQRAKARTRATVSDLPWLMHNQYREFRFRHLPGSEWLPPQWLEDNACTGPCAVWRVGETEGFSADTVT